MKCQGKKCIFFNPFHEESFELRCRAVAYNEDGECMLEFAVHRAKATYLERKREYKRLKKIANKKPCIDVSELL